MKARGREETREIGESIIFVSMEDEIWNQADRKLLRRVKRIIKSKYEYMLIPERKKVGKILDSIQRSIQMRYYDSRQYIYYMDYIIEKYREKTNMFKREVHNSLDIDILLEYIGGLKFNLNDFNDLFGSGIERPFVEVEELKQAIIDKKQGIGEHNSKLLLQQLITNLIDKHWLYYKNDLERMKYYVLGYGLAEMEMIEFIEFAMRI